MYQGYRNQISTNQLERQLEMLECIKAKRYACQALGLSREYPNMVRTEMDARLQIAFRLIDEPQSNDNGVQPQSQTPPMPYEFDGELEF